MAQGGGVCDGAGVSGAMGDDQIRYTFDQDIGEAKVHWEIISGRDTSWIMPAVRELQRAMECRNDSTRDNDHG